MKVVLAFLVACLIGLGGCATVTSGVKVDESQLSFITKGQTRKEDVVGRLGNPTSRAVQPNGLEVYSWLYTKARASGFISMKTESESSSVTITFDRKGTVQEVAYSESNSGGYVARQ